MLAVGKRIYQRLAYHVQHSHQQHWTRLAQVLETVQESIVTERRQKVLFGHVGAEEHRSDTVDKRSRKG